MVTTNDWATGAAVGAMAMGAVVDFRRVWDEVGAGNHEVQSGASGVRWLAWGGGNDQTKLGEEIVELSYVWEVLGPRWSRVDHCRVPEIGVASKDDRCARQC